MTFREYLQKTIRQGSFFVKLVKLVRLCQHTIYYLGKKKIGDYPIPPEHPEYVGFFDKNRLVHPEKGFEVYFYDENIYREGEYEKMKPGIISLVLIGKKVLIRKVYHGFQKYNRFYNELICLHKLVQIDNVPKVRYVNYRNCEIYMDYIDGLNLLRCRRSCGDVFIKNVNEIEKKFFILLNKIHASEVIMYDIGAPNMMKLNKKIYLIDFADAMYFGRFISRFIKLLKIREIDKLRNVLMQLNKMNSL